MGPKVHVGICFVAINQNRVPRKQTSEHVKRERKKEPVSCPATNAWVRRSAYITSVPHVLPPIGFGSRVVHIM